MTNGKFDPFEQVLVRDEMDERWMCDFFSQYDCAGNETTYYCVGGEWKQCIPYKGNESLRDTTVFPGYEMVLGDFLTYEYEAGLAFLIYKGISDGFVEFFVAVNASVELFMNREDAEDSVCYNIKKEDCRPSSRNEKSMFISYLRNNGLVWDEQKRELKALRWRPKEGETYYYCRFNYDTELFEPGSSYWYGIGVDTQRMERGLVFSDWADCDDQCNKMNESMANTYPANKNK